MVKKINYHQMVFPINLNDEVVAVAGLILILLKRKRAQQVLQESTGATQEFRCALAKYP